MAYTEFFSRSGGSNLNGGGLASNAEPSTTAAYTSTNGNWSTTTHQFTPTDGSTPASSVTVGDWASIYIDGASVAVCCARVTVVAAGANGAITVSSTALAGTFPTTSATTRSIKVGGAWLGPNAGSGFPMTLSSLNSLKDANSDQPRINFKNDATYSITAAISAPGSAIIFQGYTSTSGDGGKAILDGGTSGASYVILTLNGTAVLRDFILRNNGASGTSSGLNMLAAGMLDRVVVHDVRGTGIGTTGGTLLECEVYNVNQSNTGGLYGISMAGKAVRCIAHDNPGSTSGFNSTGVLIDCIADTNGSSGFSFSTNDATANGCVAYNNGGAGFFVGGGGGPYWFENCIAANNGTYGLNFNTNLPVVTYNMAYYSNTTAPTIYAAGSSVTELGTITLTSAPFVDAPNGDFRPNTTETQNSGRGAFTQTASSYGGTTGFPDVGAAQHQSPGVGHSFGGNYTYIT